MGWHSLATAASMCVVGVATVAAAPASRAPGASSASTFPVYKQCDPRWGGNEMGVQGDGERATICREGCAMSCVASALTATGFTIPGTAVGTPITPGSLNDFLVENRLYTCAAGDCNNLVLTAPDYLTTGRFRFVGEWPASAVSTEDITAGTAANEMVYIAHVHNPQIPGHPVDHFVLVQGYDAAADAFTVMDPYYNMSSYPVSSVADYLLYEVLPHNAVVPVAFPLMKQCDPAWGPDRIHVKTVCDVGCLMSSTAMSLAQRGIKIDGNASTVGRLNAWLLANGGYVGDTDDLDESKVSGVDPARVQWTAQGMHTTNDIPWAEIVKMVDAAGPVIANVMHGGHFVLVVGYDDAENGDTLYVNDPGFNRPSYSYKNDVVGWRLYNMTQLEAVLLQ